MPFNDVFNFLDNVYKGISSDVSKVVSPIESGAKTIGSDIAKVINPVKTDISGVERAISGGFNTVRTDLFHNVVNPIEHYTKPITTDIYNVGKTISSDFHTVGSDIAKIVNPVNLYHTFSGAISDISHVISQPIVEFPKAIQSDISAISSMISPPSTASYSPPSNNPPSITDFLKKYGLWLGLGVALILVVVFIARKK